LTFGVRLHHPPDGTRKTSSTPRDADMADGPIRLKLARRGAAVTMAVSFDGKDWHEFGEIKVDWPAGVKFGVFVAHDTDQPFEAGFEDLKVTRVRK
jgi:regulation of enolase protein 1 (concanavalin A-like superfamily)